ncbi:MAG: isocitrate/isopropylmalate family dehydrogenase [Candidatus Bathyarchaeota archaeon]|nr:isocitrate/isopropylmalate family dehydrogenase [Candidatus Bathyarchaeota archaeon]
MGSKTYEICEIQGDGIGPEIMNAAKIVIGAIGEAYNINVKYRAAPAGDAVKKETGSAVPEESIKIFQECDAGIKGPVGESVRDLFLAFRKRFGLYVNIRPAISYPNICPPALRPDINLVVIRENSEGIYRAMENEVIPGVWTVTGVYTQETCERIARFSFNYAMRRLKNGIGKGIVACAHKANIIRKSHGMFSKAFEDISSEYPEIRFENYYADALTAHLVRRPHEFDTIVSTNLLADLLSDLAGQIAGGLGMTAGTNMNPEKKIGLFEPTHGSAPDIAGTGKANPIGMIRSISLMFEFLAEAYRDNSCLKASIAIEKAIEKMLSSTQLPMELSGKLNCTQVGEHIAEYIKNKI